MPERSTVPFREALRTWAYVGLNSFGGPAGQIAVMHRVVVLEKRWISEERFHHALNFCMLLPGPEAQQLSIYLGWLLHRTLGGLVAGILFVLPGALAMLGLSILYATSSDLDWVRALFFGVKCAVLAIVFEALLRIAKRALKSRAAWTTAALAFVAVFFVDVPFPIVVGAALVLGFAHERWRRTADVPKAAESKDPIPDHARPSLLRAARVLVTGLALWFGPLLAIAAVFGPHSVYARLGLFFSQTAVVTFGGAYAVLAHIADRAVEVHGWLEPGQMIDGIGLAETTPGPLILVLQFVGFLGAYRDPGALAPIVAGTIGAAVTLWATFVPCFLWIFLGAPWIEALRQNRAISAALASVTAAVVGVILNLALWFALHVLFARIDDVHVLGLRILRPAFATFDAWACVLVIGALVAMFRFRVGMLVTIAACAAAGVAIRAITA